MLIQIKNDDVFIRNGNNAIKIVPSFKGGLDTLKFFDGIEINKIIKRKSKQTFVDDKSNKVRHYYNYFVQFDNGIRVQIKSNQYGLLDALSVYEG